MKIRKKISRKSKPRATGSSASSYRRASVLQRD
jgi:hypothetical protein